MFGRIESEQLRRWRRNDHVEIEIARRQIQVVAARALNKLAVYMNSNFWCFLTCQADAQNTTERLRARK